MAPGVASKAALMVAAEPVERVLVLTDSSELDSVCRDGGGGSGEGSWLGVSGDAPAVAAAAARSCCFWAKATLMRRRMSSMPPDELRAKTPATRLWTGGDDVCGAS